MRRTWIFAWGTLGIGATFVEAIVRLAARAGAQLSGEVSPGQWLALAVLVVAMAYIEGYRALQRRFAPSVVARATEAADSGRTMWAILAPIYAISLIGAPGRTIARSAFGVVMIGVSVHLVRALPAPWRGIVDAAVAVALVWGLIALLSCFAATLRPAAMTQEST